MTGTGLVGGLLIGLVLTVVDVVERGSPAFLLFFLYVGALGLLAGLTSGALAAAALAAARRSSLVLKVLAVTAATAIGTGIWWFALLSGQSDWGAGTTILIAGAIELVAGVAVTVRAAR
jgi:hypothetical protein